MLPKDTEVICIMCPLGCRVTVTIDDKGNTLGVANNQCKEGEKYATAELKFPGRILTTTVLTEDSSRKLLPVRTRKAIRKEQLIEVMRFLSQTKVRPPINIGQVVVQNIMGTGVDLVSCDSLRE